MTEIKEIHLMSKQELQVAEEITISIFEILKKHDCYDVNGLNLITTSFINILGVLSDDGIINANFIYDTAEHIKSHLLIESNLTLN